MDNIAILAASQRAELFSETAAQRGMTPAIVEKDFWVTWVLSRLFADSTLAAQLMFKGGTSLSKVYGLIERFSEDIDLILDWQVVSGDDPLADRSKTKQDALNKAINQQAEVYIAGELLSRVRDCLGEVCQCEVDEADPYVINVRYPGAFSDEYLRPEVRLEVGPLASWLPFEQCQVSCYAAEVFPQLFDQVEYPLQVIKAERTFWEKATILHHEAHRPEGNPQPARYSRHYYDMAMMAKAQVKTSALADLALLEQVVAFKQRFYPRGWARYDLAVPGSLKLVPEGHVLQTVEEDYQAMRDMIFGEVPTVSEIMETLLSLENEINQ